MNFRKTALLILAALTVFLLVSCSEKPVEHRDEILGGDVIITPESPASSSHIPEKSENSQSVPESSSSESAENPTENEDGIPMPEDLSLLILVNPNNRIPDDYAVNLENVQGKYNLDAKAAGAAKELLSAAKTAGFDMLLCSAYRTIETSERLYNNKVNDFVAAGYSPEQAKIEAARWVAPPGTSEHHTGLAMDLVSSDYWGYYTDLEHGYENFDSFRWLSEHCAEFGFILRYPKDKQDITGITYEPWHYRYVGKEAAEYIMQNSLCLEEYLEMIA